MKTGNKTINAAKAAKNDEFYTLYEDIAREVFSYPTDTFAGKSVLCPCNDHGRNFERFFLDNFGVLGLERLVTVEYGGSAHVYTPKHHVVRLYGDGEYPPGDFRSADVMDLIKDADMVVTNPPFSLFRPFFDAVVDREFLILGINLAASYTNVFPHIMAGRVWLGATIRCGSVTFKVPDDFVARSQQPVIDDEDDKWVSFGSIKWWTNIKHGVVYKPIRCVDRDPATCQKYYDVEGINVPRTERIPANWDGLMGVPLSYMDRHDPERFEIVGVYRKPKLIMRDGSIKNCFSRIVIRHRV